MIKGNQSTRLGTIGACTVVIVAETITRLATSIPPQINGVTYEDITVVLEAGNPNAHLNSTPQLYLYKVGSKDPMLEFSVLSDEGDGYWHIAPTPVVSGTYTLRTSAYRGLQGDTLQGIIDSYPEATHVAFRWSSTGELGIKPEFDYPDDPEEGWPSLAANSQGVWSRGDVETMTVWSDTAGVLHLIFIKQ